MSSSQCDADCFALLDDSESSPDQLRSRLYTAYAGTLLFEEGKDIRATLAAMQEALKCGKHAVGMFSYEFGADLIGTAERTTGRPLGRVLLFNECRQMSADDVVGWLHTKRHAEQSDGGEQPSGIANVRASVSETEFVEALGSIREYMQTGDTYQVNYTYRLRFDAFGSLFALYLRLRLRQPVPYGALIALPDGSGVLSFSPELFVRHVEGELTARPMKGTAPATGNTEEDEARSEALRTDAKTRAENLMIVDLLRNDLGRISEPGSVKVPDLFTVTRYGSVLQMTSTISARLRDDATLADVFTALYPCGSITGAPKLRTMQIIRELEPDARGLYTGGIGWFDAPGEGRSIGDFCMSVPIRTLELQPPGDDGLRKGEMGIGAGIVYDSDPISEYNECRLKARFLTGLPNDFELFETIHATHVDGCRHLERHLERLRASAAYFGFPFDEVELRRLLAVTGKSLAMSGAYRIRLSMNRLGVFSIQAFPLSPLQEPVKVMLASQSTTAADVFLRHKTTVRERYDAAWKEAEKAGAFDKIFSNEKGELTEGGRTNLFVKLDGSWYTPPLSSGLLPGVMRGVLLSDPTWAASERRLTLGDLREAEEVVVCNALRGALRAVVDFS